VYLPAAILAAVLLSSCSGHPLTDDRLISVFEHNRTFFAEVAREAFSRPLVCPYTHDPDVCEPRGEADLLLKLRQRLRVPILDIYVDRKGDSALRIPVES